MSARTARALAIAYFVLFAVAVTWPGMIPFNRIRPLVLGLPLSLAWVAFWVAGGALVLWGLDAVERKAFERNAVERDAVDRDAVDRKRGRR